MTGRNPPQDPTLPNRVVPSRRSWKTVSGGRACVAGLLALAGAWSVTVAAGATATARPFDDDEPYGPRMVLGGRASLDRGELGDGEWLTVTDTPDRLVLVAGAARVRIVVDASLGATSDAPGRDSLVTDLAGNGGHEPARYEKRPAGAFVVLDADTSEQAGSSCTALPWQEPATAPTTLTGEGDAKVVLGTPCTVERAYVVGRSPGNLLIEAQAPRGDDDGQAAMEAMDALVMTLVPAGADIDDDLSPLDQSDR